MSARAEDDARESIAKAVRDLGLTLDRVQRRGEPLEAEILELWATLAQGPHPFRRSSWRSPFRCVICNGRPWDPRHR